MHSETDSIPRTTIQDLFFALRVAGKDNSIALELLRQHFCVLRGRKATGDLLWSTAAYNAQELSRLGLLEVGSIPKNRRSFEQFRGKQISLTDRGRDMLSLLNESAGGAYDSLFKLMFGAHPYLRAFVRAINKGHLMAPVVTSLKDHVSPKYASTTALADDVAKMNFDSAAFTDNIERRVCRTLTPEERSALNTGIHTLLEEVAFSAATEDSADFAKKFLLKLNDYVMPAIFATDGLVFDYKTHRTLWAFGQEWKLWQSTSDHPEFDGRLVFRTATIRPTADGSAIADLVFDTGLAKVGENFLQKLYNGYIKVQRLTKGTYALAWQLRAVFCFDHACQESVFDRLMEEHYTGSDEFELDLEIQRQHGQYDRPLRVGKRKIGLVRVIKK